MKKQKIEFCPEDFKGCGQMLIRDKSSPSNIKKLGRDIGFASTICYKVGYISIGGKWLSLLISLADGMSLSFDSLDDLCIFLNKDSIGYKPMTTEEISLILSKQGNRFNKV